MTSDPGLSQRVSRLENDVESIYELLAEFRTETREHFEVIDDRLDRTDGRLDTIDGRLDSMDGRLDSMDGRLDSMDGTLATILQRLPAPS